MNNPSPEEVTKTATHAFANHLLASGKSPEQIKTLIPKYASAREARVNRLDEVTTAILGKRSVLFAPAQATTAA